MTRSSRASTLRMIDTYSRVRASGFGNGWPYHPSTTCGPDTPRPSTKRPLLRWSIVSAAIAVAVGVRAESWTRLVPRRSLVVAEPHHASGVKASEPHDSAVHIESKPSRSASAIGARRPRRGSGAPVSDVHAELHGSLLCCGSAAAGRIGTDSSDARSSAPMTALDGHAALVTGGGSGIGLAVAQRLAADGATVTICGRTEARLRKRSQGTDAALAVRGDVTDEEQVQAAVAAAAEPTGALNMAVACAGGSEHLGPLVLADVGSVPPHGRPQRHRHVPHPQARGTADGAQRWRIVRRGVVHRRRADPPLPRRLLRGQGGHRDAGARRGRRVGPVGRAGELCAAPV